MSDADRPESGDGPDIRSWLELSIAAICGCVGLAVVCAGHHEGIALLGNAAGVLATRKIDALWSERGPSAGDFVGSRLPLVGCALVMGVGLALVLTGEVLSGLFVTTLGTTGLAAIALAGAWARGFARSADAAATERARREQRDRQEARGAGPWI